jgi:DNA-binding SARP family transcriptional activator
LLDDDAARDESDECAPFLVIDADGWVVRAAPEELAAVFARRRCCQLRPSAAADLLAPIVAAQNDEVDKVSALLGDVEEDEWTIPSDTDKAVSGAGKSGAGASGEAALGEAALDQRMDAWPTPSTSSTVASSPPASAVEGNGDAHAVVRARLLGPPNFEAFGKEVKRHLRTSAIALFAWFALRPEGATRDAAADALYPGASHEKGRDLFWTSLGNLRSLLGKPQASNDRPLELISKVVDRYVPDPAMFDIDLWHFEAALRDAAATDDPTEKAGALERALLHYGGDFCQGFEDLWCVVAREDLRRRALDAAVCRAGLIEQHGEPAAAIAAWERVVALDPIAEASSRRLAALLVEMGRLPEAIAVGRRLTRNLDLIELEPTEDTDAFFAQLRARQRRIDQRRSRGDDRH